MRVLIACLFIGGVLGVPVKRSVDELCETGSTRFKLNTRYTYHYVATSLTGVNGTTNQTTGLRLKAKCDIEGIGNCQNLLRISNVRLLEATPNKKFKPSPNEESFKAAIEADHLFFTENNGAFVRVSPVKTEPLYVTNIKRGILSALQLQFTEEPLIVLPEVDVSGNCSSEYKIVKSKQSETEIIKTRNLSNCSKRSHNVTKLNPVMYGVNSTVQGLFISTSSCRYQVENHVKKVECNETHLLRPFSFKGAGVTTNVTVNLTLESTHRLYFPDYETGETRKSNLLYEHTDPENSEPVFESTSQNAEAILEELITVLPVNETKPITAVKFTSLVFSIRKLDVKALRDIWTRFYNCDEEEDSEFTEKQCKKSQAYVLDAFTQCGSTPCMMYIIEAIRDYDQVKSEHFTYLLTGMSSVQNPSPYLFAEVIDMLQQKENLPKTTLLSLGTMIRKYCQQVPDECFRESESEVMDAVDYLEKQLPKHCDATPSTVDDVIITLKAIGNAGRMRSKGTELVKCSQGTNYLNVSVVAIETIRRFSYCPDTWKSLKREFGDFGKDPELRLQAYLALMKYPSEQTVRYVAEVLDDEINTQVGAFVSTHLRQMNDSVEPTYGKMLSDIIKKALKERESPLREFNTAYKSRFMQKSYINEENNLGFSTESHIIYHPESLLPRSAELNMTLDLWGGAFPVVETSTRFEGLEIIWEKLFGHKGYFPDNHIRGLIDTPMPTKSENDPREVEKRYADNLVDMKTLDSKVNLRTMTPSGFLSLKLFGNDFDLFTLKDLEWLEEDDIPLADLIELLRMLSRGVDKTFTKSVLFLEETYVIPTSLGLPLNLSINGTSVTSVHVQGKADLSNLFWGVKKAVVKGTVKPSAAIVLSGKVTLDAFHFSTGVLLNGSISTSTELQGNVTYNEEQGLKSHINVTEKPQEILNITTSLFHHMNNVETPIRGLEHRNTTGICSMDIFNSTKLIGLNLCSNISIPVAWYNKTAPFFPLTGPANFSIYLNKTDALLTNFKLEANFTKPDKNTNKTVIAVCTPGASFKREYFFNVTLNHIEEVYRWNASIGASQENATTIDFIHVPLSHAVNITLNVTKNLTAFYFHRTCHMTHKIKYGLALNATLFNRSLYHTFFLMNDTHKWYLETNMTVKYATERIPISVLYLNTSLNLNGNTTGNLTLNITHRPLNLTLHLQGLHNMTRGSMNVTWNVSCPAWSTPILNNNMTINVTYINATNGYKTQVNVSSNGTQMLSCYKEFMNSTDKNMTVFYCNATTFNKTSLLNMTLTNTTQGIKICHLNITHQNRSITLNTTWMYNPEIRNVSLNITYLNHSIVLLGSLKNYTLEKGICFNSTYFNGTHSNVTLLATCLSYVNATERKSLIFNVTSVNTTAMVNTTWFANSTARGILVNCTYHNRTIFNMTATYSNTTTTKNLHFNFSMGNWSAELNHTYFSTEMLPDVDQIRSINITHRIKNGTTVVLNSTYIFTFFNTTTKKDIVLNLTFTNRTYGAQVSMINKTTSEGLHHIVEMIGYTPNRTVSWIGVLKNATKMFNLTSLVQYQPKKVLNHTVVWNKEINHVNVSIDILPNITVSLNCSGTFNTSINVTANVTVYNHTLLWDGFASNMSVVSNLTLWNRTIEFVTRTCNVSHSAFFNLSTWHHYNKTAFNGSVAWYIDATERISYFNVSSQNVTWFLKIFSDNETHINNTIYRINGSEIYTEWSREVRADDTIYDYLNMTSVRSGWKELNNCAFNIPSKLANITLNVTLGGVNMTKFRTHFKYVLKNVTQEVLVWNYTTENVTENLFNLTMHLLNVTSRSIPNVTANYLRYFHGNKMNSTLFYYNLAYAVYNVSLSNVTLKNITEEMIVILQNFTDHVNTTAVLGNITNIVRNMTWYNQTYEAFIFNLTEWGRNATCNLTVWLNRTISEIGNWTIANRTVNYHLKTYLPGVHNLTLELLNSTVNFTDTLKNVSLVLRNFTHNVTEYILNVTHPVLYNISREILINITGYINGSSFLGGVAYPVWQNFTEVLNISVFNFTYELFHNWTICNSSLEWFFPSLQYPVNITLSFHKFTSNTTLYQGIEGLLNKSLEMYNATIRSPARGVNRTHEWLVNVTDIAVMLVNDTVNVLNVTSNKTTQEIIELYINRTHNMTIQVWNMTVQLLTSTNFSKPLNETWELLNFTTHYNNWTHCMPWTRPALKKWNSTMFQVISVMRNNSWQNYTRYYFPRLVQTVAEPIETGIYAMTWCLSTYPANTTVTEQMMNSSFAYPPVLRRNYTKDFYQLTHGYMNMTRCTLNVTRNMTELFLNSTYNLTMTAVNITANLTRAIYNLTFVVVNTTASFVNGSLVNETIHHNAHLPTYFYFNMMNFTMNITDHTLNYTMCMLNQTVHEYLNRTLSPVFTTWKTLKALSELKSEDIVEMLQPENETAMIFGKHIYTFDKRYFQFPGTKKPECGYLVTRDFKDGNFTVISASESLIITTNDAVVKIYRDGKVKLQDLLSSEAKVFEELPVQFKNTTVVRDGPYINLTNDFGFSVECDMEHFICSHVISGFYHNRTAGLLGTNNGEPSDDWLSPSGKNRTRLSDFVNSWLVRGDCKVAPENEIELPCNRAELQGKRCDELFFEKTSPLSKCFSKVNPVDFMAACKADYQDCDISAPVRTLHCNVTAAYVRECKRHGIEMPLPDECSSCDVNEVIHEKNSTWRELNPPRKVDVVFVCSEGEKMESVAKLLVPEKTSEKKSEKKSEKTSDGYLPGFVQLLDEELKKLGISPQFGLVGFSGKGPVHRPGHVHTIRGRFLSDAKDFTPQVIENMEFAERNKKLDFQESDGYLGLMKAKEYPFRPAAVKLFILVTDSVRVSHSSWTNETVANALTNISARVVAIGDFPFKRAIAVDTYNYLYHKKGESKGTKWSDKLPEYDEYAQVIAQTQGVAINLKAFEHPRPDANNWQTRLIFDAIRRQVEDDIDKCKQCTCVTDEVGKGKTMCKTVSC